MGSGWSVHPDGPQTGLGEGGLSRKRKPGRFRGSDGVLLSPGRVGRETRGETVSRGTCTSGRSGRPGGVSDWNAGNGSSRGLWRKGGPVLQGTDTSARRSQSLAPCPGGPRWTDRSDHRRREFSAGHDYGRRIRHGSHRAGSGGSVTRNGRDWGGDGQGVEAPRPRSRLQGLGVTRAFIWSRVRASVKASTVWVWAWLGERTAPLIMNDCRS